jgi:hypothetical protein
LSEDTIVVARSNLNRFTSNFQDSFERTIGNILELGVLKKIKIIKGTVQRDLAVVENDTN